MAAKYLTIDLHFTDFTFSSRTDSSSPSEAAWLHPVNGAGPVSRQFPFPSNGLRIVLVLYVLIAGCCVSGCATLPNTKQWIADGQRMCTYPKVVGPRRKLSIKQSKAVLDRLRGQSLPTDILDRQVQVEEFISCTPLTAGNKVTLLVDGPPTYEAMDEAIRGAKDHINFETFIFDDDEIGRRFADLLIQKQAEGVQVNVIYDSGGSYNTPSSFFERMQESGVQVLEFNPVNPLQALGRWRLTHRDHRKILVVDGKLAITGGVNITKDYSRFLSEVRRKRRARIRPLWRDTDVQIEGPAVADFQRLFLDTWERQHGPKLAKRDYFPPISEQGTDLVRVIGSSPETRNGHTFMMYISAITFAQRSIHLTNSYFVPDKQMMNALVDAAKRGVDVQIILPAESDHSLVITAGRSFYRRLLEAGVKLYEHKRSILHAKTAVIDGVWSSVGSTNMDLWSFLRNDEVNTVILGHEFADQMEAMFENDIENSRPITLENWKRRPFGERIKEWFARRLSYWL